jgi:hypothetical protein
MPTTVGRTAEVLLSQSGVTEPAEAAPPSTSSSRLSGNRGPESLAYAVGKQADIKSTDRAPDRDLFQRSTNYELNTSCRRNASRQVFAHNGVLRFRFGIQ